ncbi:hypothetical protein AAC387_Pa02g1677 [Persea americana]
MMLRLPSTSDHVVIWTPKEDDVGRKEFSEVPGLRRLVGLQVWCTMLVLGEVVVMGNGCEAEREACGKEGGVPCLVWYGDL